MWELGVIFILVLNGGINQLFEPVVYAPTEVNWEMSGETCPNPLNTADDDAPAE